MISEINCERMTKKIQEVEDKLVEMKKQKVILVESANKYLKLLIPILKKRNIKITSTQIYFSSKDLTRALAHISFDRYGGFESVKVKNLAKAIEKAGIPCPIGAPTRDVTITLYPETLFENRLEEVSI